jgi:heme-degrading monooxygenase HmoA
MPAPVSLAKTPPPPYYAAIFTSQRMEGDRGYGQTAQRMFELARDQPGFLGAESVRGQDGFGITVSYWSSEEAIAAWKAHLEHKPAQDAGKRVWYADYLSESCQGRTRLRQDAEVRLSSQARWFLLKTI